MSQKGVLPHLCEALHALLLKQHMCQEPDSDYEVDDAIAYVRTSTDDENNYYGHAIPVYPGDADNDGALDLLVGDYGYAGEINGDGNTHTGTGAFYVYFGL